MRNRSAIRARSSIRCSCSTPYSGSASRIFSEGGGPFLGVDECAFVKPVYVGDTLIARSTVVSARESKGQAGYGIVTLAYDWHESAAATIVIEFDRTNLVRRRETPA